MFDENYGLASTQALKNKDIPEGGSKGVILPDIGATPRVCFEKYVDSIIDLLLPGQSPGIKEQIVDLYKKEEIVSQSGPDAYHIARTDHVFAVSSSSVLTREPPI